MPIIMSTWVFFYALNAKQGKEELYDDLTSATKYEKSFADFIAERTAECAPDFEVTYQEVIASVENHFEDLLPSQLREITNWYENMFYRQFCRPPEYEWEKYNKAVESTLRRVGIEPLFEITSSSASCYSFIFRYGMFASTYKPDAFDEKDNQGSNIKSYEFIRFLDYVVLLMCKIHDESLEDQFDYTELTDDHQKAIEFIKIDYQNDTKLHELINEDFEWIKGDWIQHLEQPDAYNPEEQTVHEHYRFLIACLNMKATLKEEHTRVVMVNG
jgi:hypothetical protein